MPSFAEIGWPHEWLEESRDPIASFSFGGAQTYGLYLLSIPTWLELVVCLVSEMLVAGLFAIPVYYTVVQPKRKGALAFLLTFFYLVLWIFVPTAVMNAAQLQNKLFRFCICVLTPTCCIFRLTEAVFGFTPKHATRSLGDFCLFFGSPLLLLFDEKHQKHIKAPPTRVLHHLMRFLGFVVLTGAYQSLFGILAAFPTFGGPRPEGFYALQRTMDPSVWKDSALSAILFQLYLSTFGEGLAFVTTLLTGRQTERLMENPMFESESPSDFWGRRWNLLVHKCLKGGVYKPVRSMGGSKALAVMGAFLTSGLFHEWLLPCVYFDYPNVFGVTSVFFAWQGMLVAVESAIGHTYPVQHLKKALPRPLRSILVILCGVPFGHWFSDSYMHSNFFEHGQMVYFSLLPLPHS